MSDEPLYCVYGANIHPPPEGAAPVTILSRVAAKSDEDGMWEYEIEIVILATGNRKKICGHLEAKNADDARGRVAMKTITFVGETLAEAITRPERFRPR